MFCVKLILWSIVTQKGTNILIFYIFKYGAEYGSECSAHSRFFNEWLEKHRIMRNQFQEPKLHRQHEEFYS